MLTIEVDQAIVDKLERREMALTDWLAENAPGCGDEQAHLDLDSNERVYWHYGYAVAMRDVLELLEGGTSTLPN